MTNLPKQKYSARATAAYVIAKVVQKKYSLNPVLHAALPLLAENERSLCQQLCYGVLRYHHQLDFISQQLLSKRLKNKDADIAALLLCGLYQLRELRIPSHAVLSETVNATKTLGKQWAKGLINASLRNYQRQSDEIELALKHSSSSLFSHPNWLIERFKNDWPTQWQSILEANNQQPPMMLRVNKQHTTRAEYLQRLNKAELKASEIKGCPEGLLLDKPCDVHQLPGFVNGDISVQDGAAQHVAKLLNIQANLRILDACAAPGGKTCHILEHNADNEVIALDIAEKRLVQIEENTQRLKLNATLIASDAGDVEKWWDGKLFDRILIDAPCSGTGVIRRHPDIKLLRRSDDIDALAEQQKRLLNQLWPLLKSDGILVYTTCSIIKHENEQQILQFLKQHPEAEEVHFTDAPAQRRTAGYQRLPGDEQLDGFYYAGLHHQ